MRPKKKVKSAEDNDDAEQDETDTSFEEPQPSTSKSLSPRSSIQSNKVDSSGLNATPPHQKDAADFEQLREKSPESEVEFRDLLDTTGEGDEREEDRAETSASNVSFVEEKIVISDDDESAVEEEQQSRSKFVTSSSKKKKKRKKKAARESHSSRSRSGGNKIKFLTLIVYQTISQNVEVPVNLPWFLRSLETSEWATWSGVLLMASPRGLASLFVAAGRERRARCGFAGSAREASQRWKDIG